MYECVLLGTRTRHYTISLEGCGLYVHDIACLASAENELKACVGSRIGGSLAFVARPFLPQGPGGRD